MKTFKMKQEKSNITIANWIALVGLAILGIFTFLGGVYRCDDGSVGTAVFIAIISVSLSVLFLILAIKARKAKEHFNLWRVVEYSAIALYIIFAITLSGNFRHYFYISSQKESLQEQGLMEIQRIKDLYDKEFKNWRKTTIDNTKNGIINANKGFRTYDLNKYLTAKGILRTDSSVVNWIKSASNLFNVPEDLELKEMENAINEWSMLEIATVSKNVNSKGKNTSKILTDLVKRNIEKSQIFPIITIQDGRYNITGYAEKTFTYSSNVTFYSKLTKPGSTLTGWLILILANILVLLNWIVTPRDNTVGPKKSKCGGIEL